MDTKILRVLPINERVQRLYRFLEPRKKVLIEKEYKVLFRDRVNNTNKIG